MGNVSILKKTDFGNFISPQELILIYTQKQLNHFTSKELKPIQRSELLLIIQGKEQGFWCKVLARMTAKRNRQMHDAVNKAARRVINHCLEQDIGTIVFGWNPGQKRHCNLGRQTNQKSVQIPTARLKERIRQIAEPMGITFIEQEESYSSQASALDLDEIPVYGKKPNIWRSSGQRVKRGLFRSADGVLLNADANGAWNIGRKANVPGMQCKPDRGLNLTSPKRLRLWTLPSTV